MLNICPYLSCYLASCNHPSLLVPFLIQKRFIELLLNARQMTLIHFLTPTFLAGRVPNCSILPSPQSCGSGMVKVSIFPTVDPVQSILFISLTKVLQIGRGMWLISGKWGMGENLMEWGTFGNKIGADEVTFLLMNIISMWDTRNHRKMKEERKCRKKIWYLMTLLSYGINQLWVLWA